MMYYKTTFDEFNDNYVEFFSVKHYKWTSIFSFYLQNLYYDWMSRKISKSTSDIYQSKRIYLDEYPEQKELRRNWLGEWYSNGKWLFQIANDMTRFSTMIQPIGFTDENFPDWTIGTVSGCKFYDFQMKFAEEIVDIYHERRWLRRN